MVDLGQKKVDSHPPFFMRYSERKNLLIFFDFNVC